MIKIVWLFETEPDLAAGRSTSYECTLLILYPKRYQSRNEKGGLTAL
jgi:hypothetical protein